MSGAPGVFAVSRAIWDDPDFADEAFTEREAMMWLIGAAAWTDRTVRGATGPVVLARGEFSFSVRFLAEKWGWSKSRVARFIDKLEKRDIIRDSKRDSAQVYTIRNYNKFQVVGLPKRDTVEDAARDSSGTAAGHERDKEEALKHLNIKTPPLPPKGDDLDREFNEVFWPAYPRKQAKKPALKAFLKARKVVPLATIMAGVKRYAEAMAGRAEYVAHAASWLNAERWTDEEIPQVQPGWRQNGTGGWVAAGSKEFEAHKQRALTHDPRKHWEFVAAEKSGGEVKVPSRWPPRN